MQRFSRRENVVLGYGPQKTLMDSSSAPKSPGRNSEVDFTDVFGGPPRRTSIHETRYGFGEIMDSSSAFRRSDEKLAASLNPWSGLTEKPVFGEEGTSRRRYSRSDFFDDIFRGNESLSSSPRKYEMKDPFAAGSQLLSPARPLPPKAEAFGSSFPAPFSLPAKLNKRMDLPTFGSPTLSRFSGQANQDKEEERNDFQSSFQSTGNEESTNLIEYDETERKSNSKEDSSSLEISKNGGHFHFSIYKWADKGGAPVAIPLRESDSLKKKDILQRCSSANGWIACENIAMEPETKLLDSFRFTDRMSSNAKSFRLEHGKNEHASLIDLINGDGEQGQIIEEDNIPKSQTENISWLRSADKNVPDDTVLHSSGGEEKVRFTLPRTDFSAVGKETRGDNAQPNDKMSKNAGTKAIYEKSGKKLSEILDDKSIEKPDVKKRVISNRVEAGTASIKGSPRNSWDNGKGRVRGKVKDFIKIFNQDTSSKPADTVSVRHSPRWKERDTVKEESKASTSLTERGEKIRMPDMRTKKSSPDVPVSNHTSNGASERNTNSTENDTVSDGSKTILEDPAESFEDNFSIEDLIPGEKILLQFGNKPEEIQAIDAKIRQWSNGKQGNIRSLLSTLQYVLWPDSGWKPVPLVDIIEGPAVKRSYQKALLCLHPDKLQQKGAAVDQKYIAEKVFDILQDAWTHFNSLDSV